MFDPPIFLQSGYILQFQPVIDIHRKVIEFADVFANYYSSPEMFSISDIEIAAPRIAFTSKNLRNKIEISPVNFSLKINHMGVNYADDIQIREYISKHVDLLFKAIKIIKQKPVYSGVSNVIRLSTQLSNKEIVDYIAKKFFIHNSENEKKDSYQLEEIWFRKAFVLKDTFFESFAITNYRTVAIDTESMGVIRFPQRNITHQGIEITHDINDRHIFNEDLNYHSTIKQSHEIIRLAFDSINNIVRDFK